MFNRISKQRADRVSNVVKWEIYDLDRSFDSDLRPEREYIQSGLFLNTTEPLVLGEKETALILSEGGVQAGETLSQVFFKGIGSDINFTLGESALKMISRTTPKGQNLNLPESLFYILRIDEGVRDNDTRLILSTVF